MKASARIWLTHETLGLASIIETVSSGAYYLEQDLKGRWHIWAAPATQPDESDHVARHLQAEVHG